MHSAQDPSRTFVRFGLTAGKVFFRDNRGRAVI